MTPRLFAPVDLAVGAVVRIDPASAHHAIRVLRLAAGAPVELFDGRGHAAIAAIVSADPCTVVVERLLAADGLAPLQLTLAQCISAADKMDWTIEKAVELGVSAIVPLQSQKAIVKLTPERSAKRREHWQRLILAASAQSRQNRLPRLAEVMKLDEWLRQPATPMGLRLVLDPRAQASLSGLLAAQQTKPPFVDEALAPGQAVAARALENIHVLCGPESGFTDAEFSQACDAGWVAAGLGPRVLRTETAGLTALAIIQAHCGDLR